MYFNCTYKPLENLPVSQGSGYSGVLQVVCFTSQFLRSQVRTDMVCNIIVIRGVATLVFHHPIYGVRFCYNGPHQTTPTRYILGFKNYPNRVIANAERTQDPQTKPSHQVGGGDTANTRWRVWSLH